MFSDPSKIQIYDRFQSDNVAISTILGKPQKKLFS